jgi:Fic/DOC family
MLAELGISLPEGARILPKGALAKLDKATKPNVGIPVPVRYVRNAQSEEKCGHDEDGEPQQLPFEWHVVRAVRACQYLSVEEVRKIHDALEREFSQGADPIVPPGVRDQGLLESAVYRAQTSLGDQAKYPTAQMIAAAYLHSIIHNHPFYNGNKRAGLVTMSKVTCSGISKPNCPRRVTAYNHAVLLLPWSKTCRWVMIRTATAAFAQARCHCVPALRQGNHEHL